MWDVCLPHFSLLFYLMYCLHLFYFMFILFYLFILCFACIDVCVPHVCLLPLQARRGCWRS